MDGAVCCGEPIPNFSDTPKKYKPSKKELLKQWDITIKFLDYGCVIGVGCKKFAFASVEQAMKELNDYVSDPAKAVEKWEEITK